MSDTVNVTIGRTHMVVTREQATTLMYQADRIAHPDNEFVQATGYCEDYPCCGHTPDDPCARQDYDAPHHFDTSINPHALCEHEYGMCDVADNEWGDDDE